MIERLFHLSENQTTVRREIVGGCTTFLTMSYIIFVQPVLLSDPNGSNMDLQAVMVATCLSSALATFIMAFVANYPIALAPAMGHNVFFSYVVCKGMNIPWETALGAVCISALITLFLSAIPLRKAIMDSIPNSLKFAIAVGIGLMISLLGFEWAGVVVKDQVLLVNIGELAKPYVWVSGLGLFAAMILVCMQIRGAILFGMIVSTIAAIYFGLVSYQGVYAPPPSIDPLFMKLDFFGALKLGLGTVIFTFFLLDFFDMIGTLVGVAQIGGFMKEGELPRAKQAFIADSVGTVAGAMLGTSTITSYVESSSGISDGARTGLASVVTGILFLLALFFSPLVAMLGRGIATESGAYVYPIIAPALIMVGFMMMKAVKYIPWDDYAESLPAFITIMLIGFSFSISEGIGFGFISYTILKSSTGKIREVHPLMFVISILFLIKFIVG